MEPTWGFCQLLSISIPITHFRTGALITYVFGSRIHWTHCEAYLCQISIVEYNNILGLLLSVSSEPMPSNSPEVWLFPFPQHTDTQANGLFEEKWGKINYTNFFTLAQSFCNGLALCHNASLKRFLVCKLAQVWNWLRGHDPLCLGSQLNFC